MKTFTIALLSFFVLPFGFVSAKEEEKPEPVEISLSTMILFAMDQNPDLNLIRERKEQIGYFIKEAQADYYPKLEANASGGREFVDPAVGQAANNPAKASITLNQKIFDGFQTAAEVRRREELERTAELDIEIEKSSLILDVINQYLSIFRYRKLEERTSHFVERIDEVVSTIADMVDAGAAGKAMLDYAKSRQASAYVSLNEVRSSLNDSISNLEYLTGPLPAFAAVEPDYLEPNRLDKEFYVDVAAVDSTAMNRVQSEIDAMRLQLEAEEGGFYPTVDLAMKAEQTHDDGSDSGRTRNMKATVNLTYELFDGFERRNRYKRVNSQISELEYKEEQVFDEIKRDIDLAYNQISSIQGAIKATNAEIASNRALQRLNKENFRLGEINAIELIEGEERLQASYARKYKLEFDLYTNIYNLLLNSSIIKERFFCGTCGENNEL